MRSAFSTGRSPFARQGCETCSCMLWVAHTGCHLQHEPHADLVPSAFWGYEAGALALNVSLSAVYGLQAKGHVQACQKLHVKCIYGLLCLLLCPPCTSVPA